MKPKVVFVIILFWVFFISTPAPCQQEEITLSTYYPAPYGEYDELCAEKLLVDTPSAQELQDMARGDCHITNSLIVGAAAGGFSYDAIGGSLTDGTVLIKGDVGIGTTSPGARLDVAGDSTNAPLFRIINTAPAGLGDAVFRIYDNTCANYVLDIYGAGTIEQYNALNGSSVNLFNNGGNSYITGGNLGIGTTNPQNRLDIEGGMAVGAAYSGTNTAPANGAIIEGNVGIGTTSPDPAAKLEVNGQVKITGGSPSAGKVLTSDANGLASWSAGREYLLYEDVKAPGTDGGQFVSGAWRTRNLTQETIDTAGIGSLSSNQITLSAGTYECFISAPAIDVGAHQIRLYNVTDSSVIKYGTSEISYEGGWGYAVTRSIIIYRFTLTAQKTLRIEHRATVTSDTSNGFGARNNFGGGEVYTVAEFWRVNS